MEERKLNRLKNYDYSQNGCYFVTVCTKHHIEWFGKIENEKMFLNKYGEFVNSVWDEIPKYYPNLELDIFTIMPNHIHGIINIVGTGHRACPTGYQPVQLCNNERTDRNYGMLAKIVAAFKSICKRNISNAKFEWQRSFYAHIIQNEQSLDNIREYIINNPLKWEWDIENKINTGQNVKVYYERLFVKNGINKKTNPL